ncbi:MAG: CamS family sex pheromone protein [Traorella sp.]
MKNSRAIPLFLLASLLIGGCESESTNQIPTQPIRESDYIYYLPYAKSSTEVTHSKYSTNKKDVYNMGKEALELAKPYFSTKNTYVMEGQVLSSSELERFDSSYRGLGLLKYKTDFNPEGLNPEKGSYVQSGNGIDMYNPILVSDIHEIDFVDENGDYVGFQFTIVLNETVTYYEADKNSDGTIKKDSNGDVVLKSGTYTSTITTEQLYTYGSIEAGQRLVNYLRNNHPEVGNLPIQILLYKTTSSDSMLYGNFIGQSYITTRASTSYEKINQEWVFAPSTRLQELDNVLANQIANVKSHIFEHFPNEVGFFGRVFFENSIAKKIEIEINMRAKTYVEIQSLIQYVVSLAPNIGDNKPELSIHVLSDGESVAIIHREDNSDTISVEEF